MANAMDHVLVSAGGKFSDHTESKPADVARILGLAKAKAPPKGLLLHFHGGLIPKADGFEIAETLTSVYENAGAYPLFFVWESGFFETLLNNKADLLRDPAFQELVKKVSEWVLKKTGGSVTFKGAAGSAVDTERLRKEYDEWFGHARSTPPVPDHDVSAPKVVSRGAEHQSVDDLATEIEAGLDEDPDPDFKRAMEEAFNAQLPPDAVATRGAGTRARADILLLSPEAQAEMFSKGPAVTTRGGILAWYAVAKFVAKVVIAVLKRYSQGRDHGVYCTVVEEVLRFAYGGLVGASVWNQMKKDTADSFEPGDSYCGSGVVGQLKKLQDQGQAFPQLTLVGHSTGAIFICNFLDAAAAAGLTTPIKIVFLAPAVTHQRFAAALRAHAGTPRMAAFRMFGMLDATECEDKLFGILYTRSLLYFVSGLTESGVQDGEWQPHIDKELVGLQRYLLNPAYAGSDFADVKRVKDFLAAEAHRAVWSPAADGPGLNSQSRRHGDFDNDAPTLASVQAFL